MVNSARKRSRIAPRSRKGAYSFSHKPLGSTPRPSTQFPLSVFDNRFVLISSGEEGHGAHQPVKLINQQNVSPPHGGILICSQATWFDSKLPRRSRNVVNLSPTKAWTCEFAVFVAKKNHCRVLKNAGQPDIGDAFVICAMQAEVRRKWIEEKPPAAAAGASMYTLSFVKTAKRTTSATGEWATISIADLLLR